MTLPDRLSTALASCRPAFGSSDHRPTGRRIIRRGDICRVEPRPNSDVTARLALVLTVDKKSVEIMLVYPYIELAIESDLIFMPDEAGTPYPIVVETEAHSAVWEHQISERVGGLSEEALREIGRVTVTDDSLGVSYRAGLPLAGPVDSRWAFTLQEVEAINELAADRISAVFDDDSPWRIDPGLLSPRLISQHPDPPSLLIELDHLRTSRTVGIEIEDLGTLNDLDLGVWTEYFGPSLGRDFSRDLFASWQPWIVDAFKGKTDPRLRSEVSTNVRWLPERHSQANNLSLGSSGRLITAAHLWKDKPTSLKAVYNSNGSEEIDEYEFRLVA